MAYSNLNLTLVTITVAISLYFTGTVCAQSTDQNAVKASKGLYIAACVTAWIAYIFAVMNK